MLRRRDRWAKRLKQTLMRRKIPRATGLIWFTSVGWSGRKSCYDGNRRRSINHGWLRLMCDEYLVTAKQPERRDVRFGCGELLQAESGMLYAIP